MVYRRFLWEDSLIKKEKEFTKTEECQATLDIHKAKWVSATILAFPKWEDFYV
jgi:hypothetical protein